jgi:hypothetical protein
MEPVPNRAAHEGRKMGDHTTPTVHYTVSHTGGFDQTRSQHDAGGPTPSNPTVKWFGDKKSAKEYGKKVVDMGYKPSVEKHDPSSPDYGKSGSGKPAKLMNAGLAARGFVKGNLDH